MCGEHTNTKYNVSYVIFGVRMFSCVSVFARRSTTVLPIILLQNSNVRTLIRSGMKDNIWREITEGRDRPVSVGDDFMAT